MRIAFYSPIAEPHGAALSGTSRVGALIVRTLKRAGHNVDVPRLPRSYEGKGDAARQSHIFAECENAAMNYLEAIAFGREPRPNLWFTYHVYYKSPDWIGPRVASALNIPYVIAEGSHAPKRAQGPWAQTHEAATQALRAADRLLATTTFDRVCLEWIAKDRVRDLKPFIDPEPFAYGPVGNNHLVAVGMMRNDRKTASYAMLAAALRLLPDLEIFLEIIGDGAFREDVYGLFEPSAPNHTVVFPGAIRYRHMPLHLGACGIFAWPGIGEAYGLAYLEAQAQGLAVVACSDRGVPDVTRDGTTALLSQPGDVAAYASNLRRVITEPQLRERLGKAGREFVRSERSIEAAARTLNNIFAELKPT
jgi:glycosyltransferase involved in cell wall biosynthesis